MHAREKRHNQTRTVNGHLQPAKDESRGSDNSPSIYNGARFMEA